jgi:predicted MFS family arabinose efflux permease
MPNEKVRFTPVLGLVYTLSGIVCAMAFQTSIAPVIDQVAAQNGLTFFGRTLLMSAPSFGSMILMIPVGKLLDRGNPVRLTLPFLATSLLCSIMSMLGTNNSWMLAWRFIAGLAFAPLFIYGIQIISLVVPPKSRTSISVIQTLGAPIAYLLTAVLSPMITQKLGFQFTYIVPAALAAIGILGSIMYWNLEIPERKIQTAAKGWLSKESLILAVCWGFFMLGTSVFLFLGSNMARTYYGFDPAVAGLTNLTFAIPAMIIGFVIGRFVDTKISRFTLISYPSIILGLLIFGSSLGPIPFIISVFTMGFAASLIPPVIFTTPQKIEHPSKIGQSIGFINVVGTFCMLISAPIAGMLKDTIGSWVAPFAYAGLMAISIFFVSLSIKRSLA